MALVGNIKDFSLVQLLNLINRGRKTGCLEIRNNDTFAQIYFADGKLAGAILSGHQLSFGEALVKAGNLTQEIHEQLLQEFQPRTEQGLALLLEESDFVSRENSLEVVRNLAVEVVQFLFTFREAEFRFDQGIMMPAERIPVSLGLESMIIEGSRQLEEFEALQDQVPDLRAVVKFADHQSERMKNIQLSGDEWRIITQIDGQSDIQSIAQRNGLNDFRIRKIIYGLMAAGLIHLERPTAPEAATIEGTKAGESASSKATQRNMVMRIINRIRGI